MEDDEQDRDEVIAENEADPRVLKRIEAAFIGGQLLGIGLLACEKERGPHHRHRNRAGNREKHQDRQTLAEQVFHYAFVRAIAAEARSAHEPLSTRLKTLRT